MQSPPTFNMDLCFLPEGVGGTTTSDTQPVSNHEQQEIEFISQLQSVAKLDTGRRNLADHTALVPTRTMVRQTSSESSASTNKKGTGVKIQKAPGAPKRFKTAFIFYSTWKHREIRKQLKRDGVTEKMVNVAKLVSETWKNLDPSERGIWEEKSRLDKERYQLEKSMYRGPWKVKAPPKRKNVGANKKDPEAPKKPMSAYLSFSNSKRTLIKRMHPDASNAQVSKILSDIWRDAPDSIKSVYIEREARLREQYKKDIAAWRASKEREQENLRRQKENLALQQLGLLPRLEDTDSSSSTSSCATQSRTSKDSIATSVNLVPMSFCNEDMSALEGSAHSHRSSTDHQVRLDLDPSTRDEEEFQFGIQMNSFMDSPVVTSLTRDSQPTVLDKAALGRDCLDEEFLDDDLSTDETFLQTLVEDIRALSDDDDDDDDEVNADDDGDDDDNDLLF